MSAGMKAAVQQGLLWAALAGMMIALCLADGAATKVHRLGGLATLHCENQPITAQQVGEMQTVEAQATEPAAFAVWRQKDMQLVQAVVLGRSQSVSLLVLRGDSTLVLPVDVRLAEGDSYGCLLDSDTAYALFGSREGLGAEVQLGGRTYCVRGIFQAPAATMVIEADADELDLDRVTIVADGDKDLRRVAEEFAMRHQLQSAMTSLTGSFSGWAGVGSQMALVAMGVGIFLRIAKELPARRWYPVQRWLLWLLLASATVLWIWAMEFRPGISPGLLPTRWSDFEFWQQTAQRSGQWFLEWLYMKKNRPDVLLLGWLGKSLVYGLVSLLLFCFVTRQKPLTSGWQWGTSVICGLAGSFAGLLLADRVGLSSSLSRALWLAPVLYQSAMFLTSWLSAHRPTESRSNQLL